jgi:signal recognition particle GTPase
MPSTAEIEARLLPVRDQVTAQPGLQDHQGVYIQLEALNRQVWKSERRFEIFQSRNSACLAASLQNGVYDGVREELRDHLEQAVWDEFDAEIVQENIGREVREQLVQELKDKFFRLKHDRSLHERVMEDIRPVMVERMYQEMREDFFRLGNDVVVHN